MVAEIIALMDQLLMLAIIQAGHHPTVEKRMMNPVAGVEVNANSWGFESVIID